MMLGRKRMPAAFALKLFRFTRRREELFERRRDPDFFFSARMLRAKAAFLAELSDERAAEWRAFCERPLMRERAVRPR